MKYEAIERTSNAEVEDALDRGDPEELHTVALSAALHAEDPVWAERICFTLAAHPHPTVRGNAVLAFGHLARRHRRLDVRARLEVETALLDADPYVRGQAEAAADDLEHFLGWKLPRPS